MKYSTIIISLIAGAIAAPQEASTITPAPASAASANLTPQQSCAVACPAGDVTCQAQCLGIARPNSSQVVETNECAAKCDQGDGTPEATDKYSKCVQGCISSYFPSSQTAGAFVSVSQVASNAASATGSAASGTGAKPTGSSTASGSASSSTSTGAASANNVGMAGAGLAGLLALFAL